MDIKNFMLFLQCFNGVGEKAITNLIRKHAFDGIELKSPEDIVEWFNKNADCFAKKVLVNNETILAAKAKRKLIISRLSNSNADFITCFDKEYPRRLRQIEDYPPIIFYKGDLSLMNFDKICAVIGTRKPSQDAVDLGRKLTKKMVQNGYLILSGLAQGCDTLGHVTCLESGGKTIAIMGTTIDTVFPKENTELANKIIQTGGLLLSVTTENNKWAFVRRDLLQTACSDIGIALETSSSGGTMHAAKATAKYNKQLIVIDPAVLSNCDMSGNELLIKEYAARAISSEEQL